jgi:hypothetical protein
MYAGVYVLLYYCQYSVSRKVLLLGLTMCAVVVYALTDVTRCH